MALNYNMAPGNVVPRARPARASKAQRDKLPMRAAQYVRMSTEHQKYSTQNQSDANQAYADLHSIEIVRTYADEGKSGLSLDQRDALRQLIADVQSGHTNFSAILVYDVSRWGRFQDPDEAAYYEYLCKRAKIKVHYCAEQFENDGTLFAAIVKNLKRAMAGEYSRELSAKVFAGQTRLLKLGFSQGASPGYGLRRLLVDENGTPRFLLARGQRKGILTDRVVLVPGPPEEVRIVRWIFAAAARQKKPDQEIARLLNRREIPAVNGRRWRVNHVHRILINEKYIGNLVWNRESIKLNNERVLNDRQHWIRVEGAIPPIVSRSLFAAAQAVMEERRREPSQEDRLKPLRCLLRKHGYLSKRLIDAAPGVPCAASYDRWFGGLLPAYKLIGYRGLRPYRHRSRPFRSHHAVSRKLSNEQLIQLLRPALHRHGRLTRKIVDETEDIPSADTYRRRFGSVERAYQLAGYLSDEHYLDMLRRLVKQKGYLSRKLIDKTPSMPHSDTYASRFGGIARAYRLAGYDPAGRKRERRRGRPCSPRKRSKTEMLVALRKLWRRHGRLNCSIIGAAHVGVCYTTLRLRFGSLHRAYKLIGYKPKAQARLRSRREHWRRTCDGGTVTRDTSASCTTL